MLRRPSLAALLSVWILALALENGWAATTAPRQGEQARLVVFEFFDSTCATCVEASRVVDALSRQYEEANRPVVFIEYDSSTYMGNRLDRWYQACPNWRGCHLPLELIDSGWRWSCGPKDFAAAYASLVDQALANPPGAELAATYARSGSNLDVRLQVVNRSGRTLGPENYATANVIVYERTKVLNTARFARAAVELPLDTPLPDGVRADYQLQLPDVGVAHWDRAVVIALLDYRPNPASERHESLQAAIALEGPPVTATHTPSPTLLATHTAAVEDTPTATATPSPSPTVTLTPNWLDTPLFMPAVERTMRLREGLARPSAAGPR